MKKPTRPTLKTSLATGALEARTRPPIERREIESRLWWWNDDPPKTPRWLGE